MKQFWLSVLTLICFAGCNGPDVRPSTDMGPSGDAATSIDTDSHHTNDVRSDRDLTLADAGVDANPARDAGADSGDLLVDTGPDYFVDESCEGRYWHHWVSRTNEGYSDIDRLTYTSLAYIRAYVEQLNADGANITLGGTLSLLVWEAGARVAWVNNLCSENSYVTDSQCWNTPQALYSYQYGMGGIHTSNFYPCRDVNWTSKMRTRFQSSIDRHGFEVTQDQLDSVNADLQTVCPGATPEPIDYYILAAHEIGVPTDVKTNDVDRIDVFPFFTPQISIDLTFGEFSGNPEALTDDGALIARFGGNDGRYSDPEYQTRILESWTNWKDQNCTD